MLSLERYPDTFFSPIDTDNLLHVTVCTPKPIADVVKNSDHYALDHPMRDLDFVVMDEADMLLEGSYLRDMDIILDKLRLIRRALITEGKIKNHERCVQYVLAAATLPTYGVKSIENYVKQQFPLAVYIRSGNMHQNHPAIHQDFVKIADSDLITENHVKTIIHHIARLNSNHAQAARENGDNMDDLQTASSIQSLPYSVMIFLNTAANAQKMAELFRELGYPCTEFHSLLSKDQREFNLQLFREEREKLMICTDSCARGLDLPHVKMVIQAEFALNVVQHLHRIGRASRGGNAGRAVNLYSSSSLDLVRSILGERLTSTENKVGSSIEKSFSRRRGFRQKIKKVSQQQNSNQPTLS